MADLRSNFESTLVTLRNQPFELRWERYWTMVLEALEYAPETLEYLNRLIVAQEEQLATADRRPSVAAMLGAEREQLRREADEAVMELLAPFFSSSGTPAERAALAAERRRIRAEIHPHSQRADPPDAYETYVLVLDYATAFATASARVFRSASAPPQPPQTGSGPAPEGRNSAPAARHATHHAPHPQNARADIPPRHQVENDRRRPGTSPADETRGAAAISGSPQRQSDRRLPTGALVAAALALIVLGSAAAAFVLKPDWFGSGSAVVTSENSPDTDTQVGPQQPASPADEQPAPDAELPSTPLDRFYAAIVNTKASVCSPPAEISESSWTEISEFVECTKVQGVELTSTFRFMLSQAGGKWSEAGGWTAPQGPMNDQLASAWRHLNQTRKRWDAQASAAVKEYASSYFGFQSHGTTGWRFAAWRCRCNLRGEFLAEDTTNVKPRLFITRPTRIQTEDEARLAYTQVKNFFLGPDAPGQTQPVERAINNVHLPFGLPGGLGMARPLESKEAAEKAWREVTALHTGIGFDVSELKWTTN